VSTSLRSAWTPQTTEFPVAWPRRQSATCRGRVRSRHGPPLLLFGSHPAGPAFDHRHLFLDPRALPAASIRQRQRRVRRLSSPVLVGGLRTRPLIFRRCDVVGRARNSVPVSPHVIRACGLGRRSTRMPPGPAHLRHPGGPGGPAVETAASAPTVQGRRAPIPTSLARRRDRAKRRRRSYRRRLSCAPMWFRWLATWASPQAAKL